MQIVEILKKNPIIPVLTIQNSNQAVPLAKALQAGGIHILEITLRTEKALEAISLVKQALPDFIVGAGTILSPEQFLTAKKAGANFGVSPGLSPHLKEVVKKSDWPFLPGAITPTEIMTLKEEGFHAVKFFPAEMYGGIKTIRALHSIFPGISFCPTGGITQENLKDYLELKNVVAVGGTWLTPSHLIEAEDWNEITRLAKMACQ